MLNGIIHHLFVTLLRNAKEQNGQITCTRFEHTPHCEVNTSTGALRTHVRMYACTYAKMYSFCLVWMQAENYTSISASRTRQSGEHAARVNTSYL